MFRPACVQAYSSRRILCCISYIYIYKIFTELTAQASKRSCPHLIDSSLTRNLFVSLQLQFRVTCHDICSRNTSYAYVLGYLLHAPAYAYAYAYACAGACPAMLPARRLMLKTYSCDPEHASRAPQWRPPVASSVSSTSSSLWLRSTQEPRCRCS